jgi:succinate-acetate transporter protein
MSEIQASTTPPAGRPVEEHPSGVVQSVADPAPLGLAAFALTTFVLSLANAHVWPTAASGAVALAIAYGGVGQLLAGMWEFRRGNTFAATAFSSFGAFWISFFFFAKGIGGGVDAYALGAYLLAWGIFTLYMTIAATRVSGAVLTVFVLLTVTFFLLAIGGFESSLNWTKAGGYVGLATAAAAWYTSFAGVTNSTYKRVVIPTWPLS